MSIVHIVTTASLLSGLASAVPAQAQADPGRQLTVMTFNIAQGVGQDNVEDLDRIAGIIRDSGADVVALQEVAVDEHGDQGVRLAEKLGMQVAEGYKLGAWHTGPGQPTRPYGMSILSKFPIADVRHHLLPKSPSDYRELLETGVKVRGQRVSVFSTHPTAEGSDRRALQLEEVRRVIGEPAGPTVLIGDLNDPPEAETIKPFLAAYTDACGACGDTYPSDAPNERIDYVLIPGGFRVKSARNIPSTASDHLPVVATLTFTHR